jgi:hypothetical protein
MATNALVANLSNNDVLLGRGTGPNGHEGNRRFRGMASHCLLNSMNRSSIQISKLDLARQLVAMVHSKKGRFVRKLSRDESKAVTRAVLGRSSDKKCWIGHNVKDLYVVVPEEVAVEKAKQAFRHQCGLLMKKGDVSLALESASCKSPLRSKVGDTTDFKYCERGVDVDQEDSRAPLQASSSRASEHIKGRSFRIGGMDYLSVKGPIPPVMCRREQDGHIRVTPSLAASRGVLRVLDPLLGTSRSISPQQSLFKINTAEELPKDLSFDLRRTMIPTSSSPASGPAAYQPSWLRHTLEREALHAALLRDEMLRLLSVPQPERNQETVNRQEQQEHYYAAPPLRRAFDPDPSFVVFLNGSGTLPLAGAGGRLDSCSSSLHNSFGSR